MLTTRFSPAPYGFGIFKPSTLWPPPPKEFRKRAEQSTSLAGLKNAARRYQNGSSGSQSREESGASSDSHQHKHRFGSLATHRKAHELADAVQQLPDDKPQAAEQHNTEGAGAGSHERKGEDEQHKAEVAEVITVKVDGEEVKLVDQIQLYATNEQVCLAVCVRNAPDSPATLEQLIYPFVSPIWQPSLGGLPPLYIVAGDKEVLRDEIVFVRCLNWFSHRETDFGSRRLRIAPLTRTAILFARVFSSRTPSALPAARSTRRPRCARADLLRRSY